MRPQATPGHTFEGGGGYDSISYAGAGTPVKVVLRGTGTDTVGADVESVFGGQADDEITGNGSSNSLQGGNGNDRIAAGDDSDSVLGGLGNDTLAAGPGDDLPSGADDNDHLDGGPGEDLAVGQEASDAVDGVDLIELRGGERDAASCEEGTQLCGAVLLPPIGVPEEFARLGDLSFLMMLPLHADELRLKLDRGMDELVDRLDVAGVDPVIDPAWPSAVGRRKRFGLF